MILQFDEASHTYTLGGTEVPSVSKIIEPLYDFRFVKPEHLEAARKRGHAIHKTVELYELGRLNRDTLHPFLEKCLVQWLDFKSVMDYTSKRTEQQVWSEKYGYAGTYDGDGLMRGEEMLLDIKGGQKYFPHKVQTMAYKIAGIERGFLTEDAQRGSLYIDEGGWEFDYHKDNGDRVAFLSLLTILKWRESHGKGKR